MSGEHLSDEEIANIVNSKTLDQKIEDNDRYSQSLEVDHKSRMPLYVIVIVAFIIATINGSFINSPIVFVMCALFGGGTFIYLWVTKEKK